ncbi:outer membrane protein assembly factor BamE [Methylomarinovum tepidoasis]|nr:outer membrane protein assembly factor BamE [Methylomarinovum sp. IN45]
MMKKHLIIIACLATQVTGCVYKIDVQQGNIVTQKQVDQLRPGMTPNQVRYVLGSPLLDDVFFPQRWDYVYSFRKGGGAMELQRLTVFFEDQRLTGLQGDFRPHPSKGLAEPEIVTVEVPPRQRQRGIFEIIGGFFRHLF